MQYRTMGSLDWKVSALGFGCMDLPSRRFSLMGADLERAYAILGKRESISKYYS